MVKNGSGDQLKGHCSGSGQVMLALTRTVGVEVKGGWVDGWMMG